MKTRTVFVALTVADDTDIFNLQDELADQTGLSADDIVVYESAADLAEDFDKIEEAGR